MSPERTWIRAPLFRARALLTVLLDLLPWALSWPVLMARIEGQSKYPCRVSTAPMSPAKPATDPDSGIFTASMA